jgi:hypothetical protein
MACMVHDAGLVSEYVGGRLDAFIMRICDVMLSFPSILIALLFAGLGHAMSERQIGSRSASSPSPSRSPAGCGMHGRCVARWSSAMHPGGGGIGVPPHRIELRHVLPNVMGPVLVLSTIQVINEGNKQLRRLVTGDLPRCDTGADRVEHQPVRRSAARRVEPAPALRFQR